MKKSQGILLNLTVSVLSLAIVFGSAEFLVRKFSKKSGTYYDGQVQQTLGKPVAKKEKDEYRIFIFGESAAYGFPVSDRYSISRWLEKSFSYLVPEKKVRVINCGGVGKNSHEISEGARLTARYQPDLYVYYVGNNEAFPTSRLFIDNKLMHLNLILYYRSHFYRWMQKRVNRLRKFVRSGAGGGSDRHFRTDVVADRIYKRKDVTEKDYERILARFRENMTNSIRLSKRRGIDVLVLTMPSNVGSISPILSFHRPGLTPGELADWEKFYEEGKKLEAEGNAGGAAASFEKARAIDPKYAELQYRLGRALEKSGRFDEAREAYTLAKDYDSQPWRATTALNNVIRETAAAEKVMFLDMVKIFEEKSAHGIVSTELVFDNVHPSITGQQVIADEIAKALYENKRIGGKWRWEALEQSRANYPKEWQIDGALTAYQPILKGILSWEGRHYDEAVKELEEGLKLMPDFIELYGFLADSYFHLGDQQKAADMFGRFKQANASVFESTLRKYPDVEDVYLKVAKGPKP